MAEQILQIAQWFLVDENWHYIETYATLDECLVVAKEQLMGCFGSNGIIDVIVQAAP